MTKQDFSFSQENGEMHILLNTPKFDAQFADAFNKAVQEHWSEDTHAVTIDMKAVEFIDSSGVGALLALRKRLPANSMDIALIGPQPGITSVLEMLRLHRIFRLEEV